MAFQPLAYRSVIAIDDFPHRWLPLLHLYDPDLPLFPILYFHGVRASTKNAHYPKESDRFYGFIEAVNVRLDKAAYGMGADVSVVSNRPVDAAVDSELYDLAVELVRGRLGVSDPVERTDVATAFSGFAAPANALLDALWRKVVDRAYGGLLPFGQTWDPVVGLARWVASWFSQSGQKGELIQTHYFCSRFGERVQTAAGLPAVDFFLLPTFGELRAPVGSLAAFPRFNELQRATAEFIAGDSRSKGGFYFEEKDLGVANLTALKEVGNWGKLPTSRFNTHAQASVGTARLHVVQEALNAFGKGPPRTVIFFMMLADIAAGRLEPQNVGAELLASLYDGGGTFQSPKVIAIYAQQCFGNRDAIPIDTWIETVFQWPLDLVTKQNSVGAVLGAGTSLGKLERLLWVAAQARKVHSSACDDALWCTKYAGAKKARQANPLACSICDPSIRVVCPAYLKIENQGVVVRASGMVAQGEGFTVFTGDGGAKSVSKFDRVQLGSKKSAVVDDFSAVDDAESLQSFPRQGHSVDVPMKVREFVKTYGR